MLVIRNLTKTVQGRAILTNINLEIAGQGTVSFLGPSGSGKTTLLRVIMGLELPEQGAVFYNGTLLSEGNKLGVRPEKRNFSLVFQEFILFPHLDVYRNITAGLDRLQPAERKARAGELLELFEIAHLKKRSIAALSGGEQQRVAIARALALRPAVLMLDEPFSNIDRKMKERLYHKLKTILGQSAVTTILATHDHAEAFFFSDRIYVLKDGSIRDNNPPHKLYSRPGDPWVAGFIGEVNYIPGRELKSVYHINAPGLKDDAFYLVRPEEFQIAGDNAQAGAGTGTIEKSDFYGFYCTLTIAMDKGQRVTVKDCRRTDYSGGERVFLRITRTPESILFTETGKPGE